MDVFVTLGGSSDSTWSDNNERTLLEPYYHVTSVPGKDIRGQMIEAFNLWLQVPDAPLKVISKIVKMLHNASLLVDDIEDGSQLRRGIPVAHKIYGVPQTINSANYAYFLAFRELASLSELPVEQDPSANTDAQDVSRIFSKADVYRVVTDEMLALHRGQGLDLFWRDALQCPSQDEYIEMVNNKTGGLFRLAVKLMMIYSTANSDIDYIPLYSDNKGFAEDLTEGKFSFPIVHGIQAEPSGRQLLNVLQKRPATPTLKIFAINYLEERTKSFDYTRSVLQTLERQISGELERLGGNPGLQKIMDALRVLSQ
ncbi:hypothetical protein NM688_g2133 [Phlebia brevispora]|uniref:Uncharacterized protein n=1 Tax=Phlebia brevispora TaxID=194682 RepID=A0ACC1T9C9_9APHY|nr:hypothetical protein NM688_g2133 [Phlebia brevispora]